MMFISGVTMFGFSRGADRGWGRRLSALAFLMFLPSVLVLFEPGAMGFNPARLTGVLVAGTLFYIGFTGLEPVLPSLVSRYSPATAYGTALGAYNSLQFLGSFAGGAVSGALSHLASTQSTMVLLITASVVGTLLMLSQPKS
jgi:sugar phosphate permease